MRHPNFFRVSLARHIITFMHPGSIAMHKSPQPSSQRRKPVSLPPAIHSGRLLVCIASQQVGLFRFLLEAYDNLALFTVIDKHVATLKLLFSPHQEKEVHVALDAMRQTVPFTVEKWPFD